MRRSTLLALALLAIALKGFGRLNGVQATNPGGQPNTMVDGKAVADAIHEFMTEMRTNVQNDVSSWRDRSYRMRQDLVTKLTSSVMSPSPSSSVEQQQQQQSRRALLTPNVVNKGWDLTVNAGTVMKNVIDASSVKVHQFLSDILGKNWATVVPANWALDSFSWDKLGMFDVHSNLHDVISAEALANITNPPETLGDLYARMQVAVDAFCTVEGCDDGKKVPTTCVGPSVNVTFVPKTCLVDDLNKQITCQPAKLVLIKTPGSCTLKHYTPFTYHGKECPYKKEIGHTTEKMFGGKSTTIDLGTVDVQAKLHSVMDWVNNHHILPPFTPSVQTQAQAQAPAAGPVPEPAPAT